MRVTQAVLRDGAVNVVWFNQPHRAAAIKPGKTYYVAGEYKLQSGRRRFKPCEQADKRRCTRKELCADYRRNQGLTSKQIRS